MHYLRLRCVCRTEATYVVRTYLAVVSIHGSVGEMVRRVASLY
jgi:hypothetical protein